MKNIKEKIKSVRFRLFGAMCIIIISIIFCLIIANNLFLERFYLYSKTNTVKQIYHKINNYYKNNANTDIELELKRIAFNNNFDIFIKTNDGALVFNTDRDIFDIVNSVQREIQNSNQEKDDIIFKDDDIVIKRVNDARNNISYILLSGNLSNGYQLFIRIPVVPIEESVEISNRTLILIGGATILISAFVASYVSKKFTDPILQLNDIANKMANLDFSQKYRVLDVDDEMNELRKSINIMSDKLENTIQQLRESNIELEKDIEEKSKIDEMRKQFISDVSHELKTPIALIQGYAEGLVENVNNDEESKNFYAEVILDESNKMDQLVKQLLELMKLEYGKREFNNKKFDIVELTNEVIKRCQVMIEEKNIDIEFKNDIQIFVNADDFYIEQVVMNYFTNALKHCDEVDGKKQIKIEINALEENNKIRVSIFNTGKNISEEDIERIWGRFYKLDSSRNRESGGTGIGLALVKAIMNNYQNEYGVLNKENGVEFYFELDKEEL